jgi:coniferyl-aldehyde dehydrogenase
MINAPANCTLMTEKIFGPVLPVIGYETPDEAIAFVAARERPLPYTALAVTAACEQACSTGLSLAA